MSRSRQRCRAVLVKDDGTPYACPDDAQPGHPLCARHTGPAERVEADTLEEMIGGWGRAAADALKKRLRGEQPADGSYDEDLVRALLPFAMPLYAMYWRVEVIGIENIPTEGPAQLVSNHSGTFPLDGAMLKIAVLKEHGRNPWLLAGDLAFTIPGFRSLLRLAGNARAHRQDTLALLRAGELVGVFPEGYKGIGKGWKRRYQLQRFGRGGFVEVAMETGAPIIPVAIIGAEETYPMIANLGFVARRLGLPYFPVTPTFPLLGPLGVIPLPSKWIIVFGEPIPMIGFGASMAEDTQSVLELTEEVRQNVQRMLTEHLPRRRRTFL
ncbi:MAG TPA: lysophospholipid acyltransferase family protein [Actinomycetota bacterium]